MPTILLIEDAREMAQIILRELDACGYTTQYASDGLQGWTLFQECAPNLVILDWMLPCMDGLEVLRRIRQGSSVPVLMLTARGEETDRVIGLELGADDYLVKPFGLRELVARIHALLRRSERLQALIAADHQIGPIDPENETGPNMLRWQDLVLDLSAYQAKLADMPIELTHTEFELLRLMLRNPGRTFTRRYLLETIWEEQYLEGDRSVDNVILRLRKKLGPLGDAVETIRSVGYRLKGRQA